MSLGDIVWTLLSAAGDAYRDNRRASDWIRHHLDRFGQPLRIAVTGSPRAGRSTLVNALVGENVAPVAVEVEGEVESGPGRQPFTWYLDGPAPRATIRPHGRSGYDVPVTRSGEGLRLGPAGHAPEDIREILVELPARTLLHAHLLDTPAVTPAAGQPLTGRVVGDADAVLYVTRHLGESDLRFLRAAQGTPGWAPVNMLVVLSRADETGGGRIDALVSAKQIARRRRREPDVHELCQDVVAVSPLIAHAGSTLKESEFDALAVIAAASRDEVDRVLLSADRFAAAEFPAPLWPDVRQALLDRLGIFGVRLAVTLIRTGSRTRDRLSDQLARSGGLTELRDSIGECFLDRGAVLKARSALLALRSMLRAEPAPGAEHLADELERAVAGAHDFQEMRLLSALRTRRVTLPGPLAAEARRLLGGQGTATPARLGAADDDEPEVDLRTRAEDALGRWQDERDNPLLTADQRRAVDVVVRSCEGMLYGSGRGPERAESW